MEILLKSSQAELFKVLGVESRIKIIELLKEKGPLGTNEMSEALGITPSAVSQHLRILRQAGLVRNRRRGYWIPYEVDPAALERCGEFLSTVCACGCQGGDRTCRVEVIEAEDKVELLRRYERELKGELEKVQARIEELKKA